MAQTRWERRGDRPRAFVACFYVLIAVGEAWLVAIVPVLPDLRERFSLSGVGAGALVAAVGLAMTLVSIPSGALSDRLGPPRVTLAAASLLALSTLEQAAAPSYEALLAGRLLFGAALGVLWTAGNDWLAEVLPDENVGSALASTITSAGIGIVAGPPVAGLVAHAAGVPAAFAAGGAAIAAATVAVALTAPRRAVHEAHTRVGLLRTLSIAKGSDEILGAAAALGGSAFTSSALSVLAPLELAAAGMSDASIGIVFGVAAGLFVVGSAGCARLGDGRRTLATLALATGAFFVCLAPAIASLTTVAVVAALCLTAPVRAVLAAVAYPLAARAASAQGISRATVIGALNVAWGGANVVGPLVAGGAHDLVGTRSSYVVVAAILAVGSLALVARRRGEPAAESAPSEP